MVNSLVGWADPDVDNETYIKDGAAFGGLILGIIKVGWLFDDGNDDGLEMGDITV